MPDLDAIINDLTSIAKGAAIAERLLVAWLEHMDAFDRCPNPDFLDKSIDSLSRLTAIRKSLIRLSRLIKTPLGVPPSGGITSENSLDSELTSLRAETQDFQLGVQTLVCPENFHPSPVALHSSSSRPAGPREPMISPPDREPSVAETREIREVAALPLDRIQPTLDRTLADLSSSAGHLAPETRDSFPTPPSAPSGPLCDAAPKSHHSASLAQHSPVPPLTRPGFRIDMTNLPPGHPLLNQLKNRDPS